MTTRAKHCMTAAALVTAASLLTSHVQADPVTATGKGIAGGVLLGAEVVMIPLGAAGVDKWWAYLLGGGLGAAGGAVGGYFVETKVKRSDGTVIAEPSLYMLAGGLALVIPAVVLTLNATAYKPEVEEGETISGEPKSGADSVTPTPAGPSAEPPAGPAGPSAEPPVAPPAGPAPPSTAGTPRTAGSTLRRHRMMDRSGGLAAPRTTMMSLLGVDLSGKRVAISLGIPAVDVRPLYSAAELAQYGAIQGTEVNFPAIRGRF